MLLQLLLETFSSPHWMHCDLYFALRYATLIWGVYLLLTRSRKDSDSNSSQTPTPPDVGKQFIRL